MASTGHNLIPPATAWLSTGHSLAVHQPQAGCPPATEPQPGCPPVTGWLSTSHSLAARLCTGQSLAVHRPHPVHQPQPGCLSVKEFQRLKSSRFKSLERGVPATELAARLCTGQSLAVHRPHPVHQPQPGCLSVKEFQRLKSSQFKSLERGVPAT